MDSANTFKIAAEGRRYVIGGASGSGKSAWILEQVKKSKRLAVWDPEEQWAALSGYKKITNRADLKKAMLSKGNFKIAFVASANLKAEFEYFAQVAFHACKFIAPLDVVAEELADVTTVAKAGEHWGIVVRRGRKHGMNLYSVSQRWSEADKTAFGNASAYIVFMQSSADDVRYISRKTRIPEAEINQLQEFYFLIYDTTSKKITQKNLPWAAPLPRSAVR